MDDGELGVAVADVWRGFGPVQALSGATLSAPYGRVTALVGPNGAGKTTLLLILATLLKPDRGLVRVGGLDVVADPVWPLVPFALAAPPVPDVAVPVTVVSPAAGFAVSPNVPIEAAPELPPVAVPLTAPESPEAAVAVA